MLLTEKQKNRIYSESTLEIVQQQLRNIQKNIYYDRSYYTCYFKCLSRLLPFIFWTDLYIKYLQTSVENWIPYGDGFHNWYILTHKSKNSERSENSITNAYRRIVRIVRIHVFMKTRYAQYATYSYTNFSFSIPIMKTI